MASPGRAPLHADAGARPPPLPRRKRQVLFGSVEGELRGMDAKRLMDPPQAREDPLFWLRDDARKNDEVLAALKAENAYVTASLGNLEALRGELYEEMRSHYQESDTTAPVPHDDYEYYRRTVAGLSYRVHCRRPRVMRNGGDEPFGPGRTDIDVDFINAEVERIRAYKEANDGALPPDLDKVLSVDGFTNETFAVTGENEEVILDENAEAKSHAHYVVGCVAMSPSHELLAYTVDTKGYETYTLRIVRLDPNRRGNNTLIDEVADIDGTVVWGVDDATIYYCKMDDAHRPYQVYRHRVASDEAARFGDVEDTLLFEESDDRHWVDLSKTRSGRFVLIASDSPETSEVHVLDLDVGDKFPGPTPCVVAPREHGCRYSVDHRDLYFYLVANRGKEPEEKYLEFHLQVVAVDAVLDGVGREEGRALWSSLAAFPYEGEVDPELPDRPIRMIDSVSCFQDFVAVSGRKGGYARVWVLRRIPGPGGTDDLEDWDEVISPPKFDVDMVYFQEEGCTITEGPNRDFDTKLLRIRHESMRTPPRDLDLDLRYKYMPIYVIKEQEVPGGYDREAYCTTTLVVPPELRSATFPGDPTDPADAPPVRMTLMWKADCHGGAGVPSSAPVHLYAYGAYGVCIDPDFDFKRLPLLNRGFVIAIAHVRGGGEEGRHWYEGPKGGKYLTKKATFLDLVECARHLKREGICAPGKLCVEGRSAGGLTVGASLNLDPSVFDCAIAGVPFVDLMTTMCDSSIPLTATEWEEWGNPNEKTYHDYMLSYSPVDNVVGDATYPPLLSTSGLHDPRVAYWEPLKWVTTLRDTAKGGPFFSKCDLDSGHFSASDRYRYLKERAFELAFMLAVIPGDAGTEREKAAAA